MVYNQARLSRALQLFHISEPYRRKRGLRADHLIRHLSDRADKYQLRFNGGVVPGSASLWVDHDDSGDYNPSGKQVPTAIHAPSKRKRAAVEGESNKDESRGDIPKGKKTKINTWMKGRQTGEQLVVTLRLKTDAGKGLLQKLSLDERDKNGYISDTDSNAGPSEWNSMGGSFSKPSLYQAQSYALRSKAGSKISRSEGHLDTIPQGVKCCSPLRETNKRRYAACTPCRLRKDHCSLKKTDQGPCRTCVKMGIRCTFEKSDSSGKEMSIQIGHTSVKGNGDLLTPPASATPIFEICTSWAHPVIFEHIDSEHNPCDFCDDYRYGMLGLGRVYVKVCRLTDGTGYEELSGGHRARGHQQTKMCRSCALERLNIVRCSHQVIEPFPDLNEDDFDFDTAKGDLIADGVDKKEACTLWCSICISPAFYACLSCQETDKDGTHLAKGSEESYGCGLVLCRKCAGTLDALGGNLEAAGAYLGDGSTLRADFDFLLSNSDLSKAYANDK